MRKAKETTTGGTIRLLLDISDGALADRLTALLADVRGLQRVGSREAADAVMVLLDALSASSRR